MSGTLPAEDAALNDAILADIAAATTRSRRATQEANERRDTLQYVIRSALASGVSVADIVKVTGLTRARIYQIRDHRR